MASRPSKISYTQISENRGRERLWLEGRRLARAGFRRGTRYRVEVNPQRGYIRLIRDDAGDRVVSGRRRNGQDLPIIDFAPSELAPAGTRVRAVFEPSRIEVVIHHEERARLDRERRLQAAMDWGVLREASVCAGIGVSTAAAQAGVERAGLHGQVDWIVDADQRYLEAADANNPAVRHDTQIIHARLEEIEHEMLTPVDLLSVSLPCDGHSRAGRTKGSLAKAEDHPVSATAMIGLMRVLDAANPSLIVSENVVEARDSATYAMLIRELERRDYAVRDVVLDARHAPEALEQRKRWFFIALPRSLAEGFDLNAEQLVPAASVSRHLRDILDELPDDHPRWRDNQYLKDKAERDAASGKGFQRQLYSGEEPGIATLRRGYAKGGSTDPMIAHPDGSGRERLLTPVEHARAKGVPEALVAGLSDTLAHQGLGQSGLWGHFEGLVALVTAHARDQLAPTPAPSPTPGGYTVFAVRTETADERDNGRGKTVVEAAIDDAPYTITAAYRPGEARTVATITDADGTVRDRLPIEGRPGMDESAVLGGLARALMPRNAGVRATPTVLDLVAEREREIQSAAPAHALAALDARLQRATGLERLSPEQLAALGAHSAMPLAAARFGRKAGPATEGVMADDPLGPPPASPRNDADDLSPG